MGTGTSPQLLDTGRRITQCKDTQFTLQYIIIHTPNLDDTCLNNYSVPSDPFEIGPELTMDCPLDDPFDLSRRSALNKLVPWRAWSLSGAIEIPRLRLQRL